VKIPNNAHGGFQQCLSIFGSEAVAIAHNRIESIFTS
jgi:hypothetical protein